MDKYYVNNDAHEIHKSSCSWLPKLENRTYMDSTQFVIQPKIYFAVETKGSLFNNILRAVEKKVEEESTFQV